jgi:hypothetical protein
MSQYRPTIARTTLASIILVLASDTVTALECYASAPRDLRHWSWRQIDGRRCWYPGLPGVSKSKLRWPSTSASTSINQQTNGTAMTPPSSERGPKEILLESVWPAPPQDSFEERFVGAPER